MHGRKRRILGVLGLALAGAFAAAWIASGKVTLTDPQSWMRSGLGSAVYNGVCSIKYQNELAAHATITSTASLPQQPDPYVAINRTWALHTVVPPETRTILSHAAMTSPNGKLWVDSPFLVVLSSDYSMNVVFPVWLPGAVLGPIAAAVYWMGHRKRWRRGLCRRCGYDRSSLPNSAPCPECGRGSEVAA